jgi:hypothetical protein
MPTPSATVDQLVARNVCAMEPLAGARSNATAHSSEAIVQATITVTSGFASLGTERCARWYTTLPPMTKSTAM